MFLVGVWHGAGIQFLLYGLLHGTYIVINHAWRIFVPTESRLKRILSIPLSVGITYVAVLVGQVFFRSNSLRDVGTVLADMAGSHGLGRAGPLWQPVLIAGLLAAVWLMPNTQEIFGEIQENDLPNWSLFPLVRWNPTLPWWFATSFTFTVSIFYSTASSTFLYFQF